MLRNLFLKILRGTFLLAALVTVWCAVLWWLIAPDFASLDWPEVASLHAVPPLLFWGGWRFWVGYDRRRQSAEVESQVQAAEQERMGKLSAACSAHEKELQRRRFGCDCRVVAMTGLIGGVDSIEDAIPAGGGIHLSASEASDAFVESSLLEHVSLAIEEALAALYASCPAALTLPIYLKPPSDVFGEDVLALVRKYRLESIRSASGVFVPDAVLPETANAVSFLPVRDSAADVAIGILEDNPELPGLILLAFDSPWWRAQNETTDSDHEAMNEKGAPAQAVFALVLTHPELSNRLSVARCSESPSSVMTPYWEKDVPRNGVPAPFENLSGATLGRLCESKPLARIHRAASEPVVPGTAHRLELARRIEGMVERAQINSAQVALAVEPPDALAAEAPEIPEVAGDAICGWMVHNTGIAERGGHRLASLGTALYRRGFDVDPIAAASNACTLFGDVGCARQVAMLALSVAQTAANQCGTLCADFDDTDRLSIFFSMPLAAGE